MLILGALGVPSVSAQDKKDKKDTAPPLTARCERSDAIYSVGDKAKFIVAGTTAGEAEYRLSEDGVGTISEGKFQIKPGEGYSITGTLFKPGFLQLRVKQGDKKDARRRRLRPDQDRAHRHHAHRLRRLLGGG